MFATRCAIAVFLAWNGGYTTTSVKDKRLRLSVAAKIGSDVEVLNVCRVPVERS
jgi:hypothetical protein